VPAAAVKREASSLSGVVSLKLSPEDTEALRQLAAREHRSMHEVAVLAIQARITADRRAAVLDDLFDAAGAEDAELLDRLAR
jgi:predicted transcriptional regulator